MPQPNPPILIPPSELIALISNHLTGEGNQVGVGNSLVSTLSAREALVLLCLRDLDYQVDVVSRQAYAHRNQDDNQFRESLKNAAVIDPGLQVLLDSVGSKRSKEQEIYAPITVQALRVQKGDQQWIADGWGNNTDEDILGASARETGREPSHYTSEWEDIGDDRMEKALDRIRCLRITPLMMSLCQSHVLSQGNELAPAPVIRRRI